jgi:hypothetical protein
MVRDFSSNEVSSSVGESGVPYSEEFQSRIISHVKEKYNMSTDEARRFMARARGQGAYNDADYYALARRQSQDVSKSRTVKNGGKKWLVKF